MLAPVIHLQPLTYEELLVLAEKLADIHAGYFGYERKVTTDDLVRFLQIEFGRVGADSHLTPREVIRDFIELLDIMYQNPDTDVAELLQPGAFAQLAATVETGSNASGSKPGSSDVDPSFAEFTI